MYSRKALLEMKEILDMGGPASTFPPDKAKRYKILRDKHGYFSFDNGLIASHLQALDKIRKLKEASNG